MAEKRRFLDVWIVESNTVYREVPFTVVADWVQQSRLLENDMLRPSGTAEWFRVGASPDFSPYLPHAEPDRVEDQAEAMGPVELDFSWKKSPPDEDEDVDMIPLIDVSLVLLIFFMLTASGAGVAAFVPTPPAEYANIAISNPDDVQLNINLTGQGDNRAPVYSMVVGNKILSDKDANLDTMEELLARLRAYLETTNDRVEVTINAHPDLKTKVSRELTVALESPPFRGRIRQKYIGTSEK
jgi:biopolymer transport protein ExbD